MYLRGKIASLEKSIESYRSSKKFEELRHVHRLSIKEKDVQLQKLKQEYDKAVLHYKKALREWRKATEEMSKDYEKKLEAKDAEIQKLKDESNNTYKEMNQLYKQDADQKATIQILRNQLQEEQGKNQKLNAQVHKDYENSSKPSSANPFHKKIENSRESSGKKPGGQIGHQGHRRKQYEVTNTIMIEPLKEYLDKTKYIATGKIIKKQVVNISLVVQVDEYQTPEFRRITNRQKVHAEFPDGICNEMNFGASVQSIAFLLNNYYNVSLAKTRDFLHEVSDGIFNISTGCVNQLCQRFAKMTEQQQSEIFDDLVKSPVLHTDFTTARVNGKMAQILICANDARMMYYAQEHKGHEGVKGTPVEHSTNTLVHDHERTFYSYGEYHQECLVHVLRYLRSSMQNESHLSWNKRMYDVLQEMMQYVNHTSVRDEKKIEELIRAYDRAIEISKINYKEHPPTKYYPEGYNLAKRMDEYRDDHIFFLLNEGIPFDNNKSERYARVIKRKLRQMITFRSFESFENTCTSIGVIESARLEGGSLLDKIVKIFDNKQGNLMNS